MISQRIATRVSRLAARRLSTAARMASVSRAPALAMRPTVLFALGPHQPLVPVRAHFYTTQPYTAADMSPGEYHKASDMALESILEVLESIGDEEDIDGFDVEYSQGVLTLKLGANGTYVLNKQPPNKQIWLSSPKSGPKRYDYDAQHNKWFYARDNHTIDEVLNTELSEILGMDVKVLD